MFVENHNCVTLAQAITEILSLYAVGYYDYIDEKTAAFCNDSWIYDCGYLRGVMYCLEVMVGEGKGLDVLSTMSSIDKDFDPNNFIKVIEEQNNILAKEK